MTVQLDRVWLTLVSAPASSLALTMATAGRAFTETLDGEVRQYAGGRRRVFTTIGGDLRSITGLVVAATPAQHVTLRSWRGQMVLYRDGHGVRMFGAYLSTPWVPLLGYGTAVRAVTLEFSELTYSEAVT